MAWTRAHSGRRNTWVTILVLFVAAGVGLLILFNTGLEVLSATRAYVGGEGRYSKSQKDAVGHLRDFAESESDADYQLYLTDIAVPLGDGDARLEMEKPVPDVAVLHAGLARGGNNAADFSRMVWLFRSFRQISYVARAADAWTAADADVQLLQAAAKHLHDEIAAGNPEPGSVRGSVAQIDGINSDLTVREDAFSTALDDAARWVQSALLISVAFGTLVLLSAGGFGTWCLIRQVSESEERFRKQYRGLPLPTYSWLSVDEEFVLQDYNDAAEADTAGDVRNWLGDTASQRYADQPDILANLHICLTQQRTVRQETTFRYGNPSVERQLAITHVYVPPLTVMLHTEDVTDAKKAEQRLRLALDIAGLGTYDWDLENDRIVWSEKLEQMMGLAPGSFGGTLADWQSAVIDEDLPEVTRAFVAVLEHGEEFRAEFRSRNADGALLSMETSAKVFRDANRRPVRMLGVTRDVTERKQIEQQREAMLHSEKLRALGQMASGIAHDLNQSLMLVASYSELARQALAQDPPNMLEVEDMMTTSVQAALDGGETVNRLLLFTRAAPAQNGTPVDLCQVVRDAAQLTAPRWRDEAQAEGRPINLLVEATGHPIVQGSVAQLREMMTNLIFNAVDAMPAGGAIGLRVTVEDDQAVIELADSGSGMTPEVQARIFEPFFTTKGERGTGLGLAMVYGIVDQHRGHIEVRSKLGEGTTFRLALPLADTSTNVQVATSPPPELDPRRSLRILVVDDEPLMTRAVLRMLKPSGYDVTMAASGEQAVEQLGEHTFDVVVSDMGMGAGMNGWELADVVRRRWPDVRFLLATGWGAAIDPSEARAKGVDAVLAKPYHLAELLRALESTDEAA